MLRECLVFSSMRLGVPFIVPRQLGAVESIPGRQFLSFFGEADRWRFRAVGAPDSPVPPSDRWLYHASRADYAADRWPGRLLAHQTVRCTPDSPVNFSRTPPTKSREQLVDRRQPGTPDTVRCTTGQSGAPRLSRLLAASSQAFQLYFL
jgi:hypothetical protein